MPNTTAYLKTAGFFECRITVTLNLKFFMSKLKFTAGFLTGVVTTMAIGILFVVQMGTDKSREIAKRTSKKVKSRESTRKKKAKPQKKGSN